MTLLLALYAKGESPMILKLKTPALLDVLIRRDGIFKHNLQLLAKFNKGCFIELEVLFLWKTGYRL
jgi:hypothetical protein